MTEREERSPAELVEFVWHRAPEARWDAWGDLTDDERGEWERRYWLSHDEIGLAAMKSALNFNSGERGEQYAPLKDEPALFRDFASLPGDADSLLRFAWKFGPLWSDWFTAFSLQVDDEGDIATWGGAGTSLHQWQSAHAALRDAVTLFDALMSRTESDALVTARKIVWEREPRRTPREEVQAALSQLISSNVGGESAVAHDGSLDGSGLRLTFRVQSLLAAMWLQLALAVDGNRRYDYCRNCGKWWDATDAYPHKKVCSDTCRKALWRREQKEAAEGASHDNASE